MLVKINNMQVDVVDKGCAKRSCFQLGFDKGTFVQGRGYTSYHAKQKPVCMRRFLHGCPHPNTCPGCMTGALEGVTECYKCKLNVVPR
jgi:hypothetical protein